MALLGVDIGTSGVKVLCGDPRGKILADVTVEYPLYAPRPGWSEQDPGDWWRGVVRATREALTRAKAKPGDIAAIGLSGQMHGSVFLDKHDRVLRRALLWNDQRTAAECDEITRLAGGRAALLRMTSNPALTGFTAPKILWLRNHEPRLYDRVARVLLPKDYIRLRLAGVHATDVSDASGTLLLDVRKRAWSKPLLSKLGIDPDWLPRLYESPETTGTLAAAAARELGLAPGIPVVAGAGDQAAGAVGNGIVTRGAASAMMGTSGVIFAHADAVETDPAGRVHTFCHAVPGKWHVMGVILAAGGAFQWFRNALGGEEMAEAKKRGIDPYELLTARAANVPAGSDGLFFLPYLTGERTPHADPAARGCFVGLTARHGKAEMARAVMEGATFAMRDALEIMRGMGVKPGEMRLSGGGAKSAFWARLQADCYGCDACVTHSTAGSAYGAMLLAGVGAGVWKTVPEACDATIRIAKRYKKNPKTAGIYDRHYAVYRGLYPALRDAFRKIAAL